LRGKPVCAKGATAPAGPYSQAMAYGGMVRTSGAILASRPSDMSIVEEARAVLNSISDILAEAGVGWDDVVSTNIFLTDLDDFERVNAIYEEFVSEPYPARSCVEVSRLPKKARIMVDVTAMMG